MSTGGTNMIYKFEGEFAFLSNFFPSPIILEDVDGNFECPTVEHYYQASKTSNVAEKLEIIAAPTPGVAKRLGRACTVRKDWEEVKDEVMRQALAKKFEDVELRTKLMATKDEYLKEGNWWHDNYWGSCLCDKCQGHGQNKLGQILMEIRQQIKEGVSCE